MALWREALLAQAVLCELTRGYRNHPQLARFREQSNPAVAIATYLHAVADEAGARGYAFDRARIGQGRTRKRIAVTDAQLRFEWQHLSAKLQHRQGKTLPDIREPRPHPSFVVVRGGVEPWERGAR